MAQPAQNLVLIGHGMVGHRLLEALAPGSYPFVPPIPGADATGCFTYRTLYDVEQLTAYAREGARSGVVIGGGLLGLEAAGALRALGLRTHVVEFAPRLMPLQVDD